MSKPIREERSKSVIYRRTMLGEAVNRQLLLVEGLRLLRQWRPECDNEIRSYRGVDFTVDENHHYVWKGRLAGERWPNPIWKDEILPQTKVRPCGVCWECRVLDWMKRVRECVYRTPGPKPKQPAKLTVASRKKVVK